MNSFEKKSQEHFDSFIIKAYIEIEMKNIFDFQMKKTQLNVFYYVMHDDFILIAKTKFDKNLLYQTSSLLLNAQKLTLIIMFLLILKNDQCTKLNELFNCRSFVLKKKINNKKTRERIRKKNYTHN